MTDNELIAEFMGNKDYILNDPKKLPGDDLKYLKYHCDWSWLMPVVEKINQAKIGDEKFDVIIYRNTCHINDAMQIIIETTGKDMCECTYKAVVEFIKWHNENKKTV